MRRITNAEVSQQLNRQVAQSSFLTELGQADLQVQRSVQSEGLSQLVLQHAGQVAFRGQAASAMDARLGHLLVLVCRVNLTQTVIITTKFSKRKQAKANLKLFLLTNK